MVKAVGIAAFLTLYIALSAFFCPVSPKPSNAKDDFHEDFQSGVLNKEHWQITEKNDFNKNIIDVQESAGGNFKLRMLTDTMGTKDHTVKFQGVRCIQRIDFGKGKSVSLDLDWNNQTNGCYLTAGLYLCPMATKANPRDEQDWIAFEYIGVPPGKNARFQISTKRKGNLKILYSEGWPNDHRVGRKIGNQRLDITLGIKELKVKENGRVIYFSRNSGISFDHGYLYIQMSSHSNYPSREIYFDNVSVESL